MEAPILTLLYHSDLSRVGQRAGLTLALERDGVAVLSRDAPDFADDEGRLRKLESAQISRSEIRIEREGGGLGVTAPEAAKLQVDGQPLVGRVVLTQESLRSGVVLELSRGAVLLLHLMDPDQPPRKGPLLGLLGRSPAIEALRAQVEAYAASDAPVLIRGETGTGKELVAAALHRGSRRSRARYVIGNAADQTDPRAAISDLFGHTKDSFTGATTQTDGLFGAAHGGTLFLDEIGELPAAVQPILYRAVQEKTVARLGSTEPRPVDVRLITATDAPLEEAMLERRFRRPLLERIARLELRVPPLRERREDIAHLFYHFLRELLAEQGKSHLLDPVAPDATPWLSSRLVARLVRYDWPGNVRQLINVVHHIVFTHGGKRTVEYKTDPRLDLVPVRPVVGPIAGQGAAASAGAVDDDALLAAFARARFSFPLLAERLALSESTLRDRTLRVLDARGIVIAARCSSEQLEAVGEACGWKVRAMEERLWSTRRAIQMALSGHHLDAGRLIME